MKTLKTILACVLFAASFTACDKDDEPENSEERNLPENIKSDFSIRYPDVKLDYFCLFGDSLDLAEIAFLDKDGLSNMAYYKGDKWLSNRKTITSDVDSTFIPEKVYDRLSKLEISNVQVFEHIFEDSKSGIELKQYQFAFIGPYNPGTGEINNYANNIIITEDGTLLSRNDYQLCDPVKIHPHNHTEFIQFAQSKYPRVKTLGSTYDGRNVIVFISDENIVKHVVIYKDDDNNKISWVKTWYPLDINTTLPESAMADKNEYESQHPEAKLTAIRFEEDPSGSYYGFTFYLSEDRGEMIVSKVE